MCRLRGLARAGPQSLWKPRQGREGLSRASRELVPEPQRLPRGVGVPTEYLNVPESVRFALASALEPHQVIGPRTGVLSASQTVRRRIEPRPNLHWEREAAIDRCSPCEDATLRSR
jgi:hypothetical protein